MKIAIIGSTEYFKQMNDWMKKHCDDAEMRGEFNTYLLPWFDDPHISPLKIFKANIEQIEWADKVVVFYNGRSQGTLCDFAVTVALKKPFEIIHMTPYEQSFPKAMQEYHDECMEEK